MHKITNKTPHPYDIHTKNGVKVIPAFGTLEAEFDPAYLEIIKLSFDVELAGEKIEDEKNPLSPADEYELITGKQPDGRWSEEIVFAEIAKLRG